MEMIAQATTWKCYTASLIPLFILYLHDKNLHLLSRDIFIFIHFFYFNIYVCKPIQKRYYKKEQFYDYDFYLVYHKTMNVIHNAS